MRDHHAINPTRRRPTGADLSADERRIYELVCRRLLSAWHVDHIWSVTTVITAIVNGAVTDRYHSSGTAVQQLGWKVLDFQTERKKSSKGKTEDAGEALPALGLARAWTGAECAPRQSVVRKKTRAPKRFTEATLLTAMETAGKTLDEKELSDAMKENGLGTPATRAGIIETLLKREYVERQGKNLAATDMGVHLIEVVHPEVKSPAMTGQWEAFLKKIERGEAQLEPFLRGIENYVRDVVGKVGNGDDAAPAARATLTPAATPAAVKSFEFDSLPDLLHKAFGFTAFRSDPGRCCLLNGDRGPGRSAGDADGRREIALLSVAGGCARRDHAGDQSADCADGGSVREAEGARIRGRLHSFGAHARGVAEGVRRLSERAIAVSVYRAGAAARAGISGDAGAAEAIPGGD